MKKKKEASGGAILDGYRSGSRSEYLAFYGLSRFCFVNQVPRQEDFGIADFFCTLGKRAEVIKRKKKHFLIYPEASFYVQVKSNKNTYEINSRVIQWLANHIANPFFICIANQTSNKLSFYTPTFVWSALALCPESAGVKFFFDRRKFNDASDGAIKINDYMYRIGKHKRAKFNIYLSESIFVQSLTDLEKDKDEKAYATLKPHVHQELKNIWTFKLIGLTIIDHLIDNKVVTAVYRTNEYNKIEDSIKDALYTLLSSYHKYNDTIKFLTLAEYLKSLGVDIEHIFKRLNYDDDIIEATLFPAGKPEPVKSAELPLAP